MTALAQQHDGETPLAILCGGGRLPFAVADAVRQRGRRVVLFAVRGSADADRVAQYPHHWGRLAQFGLFCRHARAEGCRDVVFIGSMVRPHVWQLRPDFFTLRLLPRVVAAFQGGDDHLLSHVGRLFEQHGFRLVGAQEVAPEILMPAGVLGLVNPTAADHADIERGLAALSAMGPFDIGQAIVVAGQHVIAVEAAEGTDLMLARIADLRQSGRIGGAGGVLIKAPKPSQDRRFDLPTIGPTTVTALARAGLSGLAVKARASVIADPDKVIRAADAEKVFVVGIGGSGTP